MPPSSPPSPLLLLQAPAGSGKTRLVAETLLRWWQEEGVPSDVTLVLVSGSGQQQALQARVRAGLKQPIGNLPIYTYSGYVRNMLFQLWPLVEGRLQRFYPESSPLSNSQPDLSGLEESEFLMGPLVEAFLAEAPQWLSALKLSPRSFKRQLIRRFRLRAEQRLTRPLMQACDAKLSLPDAAALAGLEQQLDATAYRLRCLDATKQLDIFHKLLEVFCQEGDRERLQQWMGFRITHLIIDDADESTAAQQAFCHWLLPTLKAAVIAWDERGGARRGYLNAYPEGVEPLVASFEAALCSPERPSESPLATVEADALASPVLAERLRYRLLQQPFPLPVPLPRHEPQLTVHPDSASAAALLEQVFAQFFYRWKEQAAQPSEFVWLLPTVDALSLTPYLVRLAQWGIPVQVLNGTQRPADALMGRILLLLLQLMHAPRWRLPLSVLEWKQILTVVLGFQQTEALTLDALARRLARHQEQACLADEASPLPPLDALPHEELRLESSRQRYRHFQEWVLAHLEEECESLFLLLSQQWLYPLLAEGTPTPEIALLLRSYQRQKALTLKLGQSVASFETRWLLQAKYGIVADTADTPQRLNPDALIIATPQKLLDWELRRPHQWWLDARSSQWCRSDEAPLYNALLHHPSSDADTLAALPQGERLPQWEAPWQRRHRAAHQLRKVLLLASEQVQVFSSPYDAEGRPYLPSPVMEALLAESAGQPQSEPLPLQPIQRATLRADQAAVLAYQRGHLAISAVPGAGKTFVTVELLLELIERGIQPERIVVLTYMESAARTLQRRLRDKLSGSGIVGLPRISTIHALAFRLLADSGEAARLGLDMESLTLADDLQSEALLGLAAQASYPLVSNSEGCSADDWQKLVRQLVPHLKGLGLQAHDLPPSLESWPLRLRQLVQALQHYQRLLQQNGLLDFNDLIHHAITLLEASPLLKMQVAEGIEVVLEDEAQDSSRLQERFLQLLSRHNGNLVRVGDPNQAITASFNTSDPEGFRRFIEGANERVLMLTSARCSPPVLALANAVLTLLPQHYPQYHGAFQATLMQSVSEAANPSLMEPITATTYETDVDEIQAVTAHLRRLIASHPEASKAVLLRSNRAVQQWSQHLQSLELPVVAHLEKAPTTAHVFEALYRVLGVLADASQPSHRVALWKALRHTRFAALVEASPPDAESDALAEALEQRWQQGATYLAATPFLALPPAELPPQAYWQQLYYDLHDWQRQSLDCHLPALLVRIGYALFDALAERSQVYQCALQAQRALQQVQQQVDDLFTHSHYDATSNQTHGRLAALAPMEVVLAHFAQVANGRIRLAAFNEEALAETPAVQGEAALVQPIQLMTLHKAKGQEFDVVFLPQLSQVVFPEQPKGIVLREADRLKLIAEHHWQLATQQGSSCTEAVFQLEAATLALQKARLCEEARLLYVGITRAKRGLHVSAPCSISQGRSSRKTVPTAAFRAIAHALAESVGRSPHVGG